MQFTIDFEQSPAVFDDGARAYYGWTGEKAVQVALTPDQVQRALREQQVWSRKKLPGATVHHIVEHAANEALKRGGPSGDTISLYIGDFG